jgi:hypothetical protein
VGVAVVVGVAAVAVGDGAIGFARYAAFVPSENRARNAICPLSFTPSMPRYV